MTSAASAAPRPMTGRTLGWALFLGLLAWSWQGAGIDPWLLVKYGGNIVAFGRGFFPPDFSDWRMYLGETLVTVQIAVWGTFLAVFCAVPLGVLCSENLVAPVIYQPTRRLMDVFRAINEMVYAMLFVVVVGLGPFAGVMALWVHTTGVLAKLFAEAVEASDPRPVEGIRATGATWLQEVIFGVIPQVLPLWISYALYRFESNVRSATVLGLVGAGGVGQVLWEDVRGFYYQQTAAVMIIVIVAVSLIDLLSQRLRRAFQ